MTWTYSGNPSLTSRDEVRFLVGDTDNTNQLATDEEISYALVKEGSSYLAAASVCFSLAAKYARYMDQSVGDLSISYSQRYQQFKELAKRLELSGSSQFGIPYAGGISQTDKETVAADADRLQPAIKIDVHDNTEG